MNVVECFNVNALSRGFTYESLEIRRSTCYQYPLRQRKKAIRHKNRRDRKCYLVHCSTSRFALVIRRVTLMTLSK